MGDLSRGLTQVFYQYAPGAVFAHEDFGFCRVLDVNVDTRVARDVDEEALFAALREAIGNWPDGFRSRFPDLDDERYYVYGRPRDIIFRPFPLTLQCRQCGKVIRLAGPRHLPHDACCNHCGGRLKQLGYVQIHNCGRMEELHLPARGCPEHGDQFLTLYDPGRVRLAFWRCGKCGRRIQNLRMNPCNCAYSETVDDVYEKRMRITAAGDPAVQLSHTVSFINLPEQMKARFRGPDAVPWVVARVWGLHDGPAGRLSEEREGERKKLLEDFLNSLPEDKRLALLNDSEIKQALDSLTPGTGRDGLDRRVTELIDSVAHYFEEGCSLRRQLTEHVTLSDSNRVYATATPGTNGSDDELNRLIDGLGVASVTAIHDFPVALCAYGFTRVTRNPQRSELNPFPPTRDGKIPLLVHPSDTEALWFRLDALRVVDWLEANGFTSGSGAETAADAWLWLYKQAPSLWLTRDASEAERPVCAAVECLLHTMSHVITKRIAWSGFAASSIAEYLIPGTLSFLLFVSRYTGSKVGGLITLFEHRLGAWLLDSVQAGHECIYDPLCSDEGGSCVGCLHREYGCFSFNANLSRAVLYGGPTPSSDPLGGRFIEHGYWEGVLARPRSCSG